MTRTGEEAAEMIATVRGEHVAMKTWFASPDCPPELRQKYGQYPSLWKEVLNWKGWKETRKAFMAWQQTGGTRSTTTGGSVVKSEPEEVPRKRKSRWGSSDNNNNSADNNNDNKTARRSRWASSSGPPPPQPAPGHHYGNNNNRNNNNNNHYGRAPAALPGLPGMPTNLNPQQQSQVAQLQSQLRQVNEKLDHVDREATRVDALPRGHRERSPSPPPVYGVDGKRKNTRAVRWRERYTNQRQDLLEQLMSLNPATRNNSLFRRKRIKKIPVPIEKHPTYNFIGLIIGPRGKTQKELEAKTGCKIAIRGKGSVKEGARGRRDGKAMEGDNEPLHVVITGDDARSVDAAAEMITEMLVVIDDEKNVHKQAQLRELALLNGTLKEEEFCQICAQKGHRAFECPKRFGNTKKVTVRCAICGDTSHPTRDCTQAPKPPAAGGKNSQELDSDYASFMAELDGKKVEAKPAAPTCIPVPKPEEPAGVTILKPATAVPVQTTLPPPPPVAGLPPPPPNFGAPPPPPGNFGALPPPPGNFAAPPPPLPPAGNFAAPPPPVAANNGYPSAPPAHNQAGYPPQQQPQPPQQQQGYPPQQQQQQQQGYSETAGWDYKSYYNQGGASQGAGGFNWWEQ